jgi:hypothetical protein
MDSLKKMDKILEKPLKKEFYVDNRVVIWNTNSTELDGKKGTILGKGTEHIVDSYIVLLDEPLPTHKAVLLPEGCIKDLKKFVSWTMTSDGELLRILA